MMTDSSAPHNIDAIKKQLMRQKLIEFLSSCQGVFTYLRVYVNEVDHFFFPLCQTLLSVMFNIFPIVY